ncbi:MAG: putative phage tail protein [Clostridia bacterium]
MRQLLEHLPDHFKEIEEIVAIMETAQIEIDELFVNRYKILDNQFLETADSDGLERLEKIYSVSSNSFLETEDRRFALKTLMIEKRPTTLNFLKNQLELICGKDNFEIVENFDGYEIEVRLALSKSENVAAVTDLVSAIIPANMEVIVDILYSKYGDFEEKTHDWLGDYSYDEMKEEFV